MSRPSMIVALTALAIGTSVAQAQLPSVRRKVRDAGRQAVTGEQPQQRRPPPKFDNTMLELNAQVVARLIKGLEVRSTTRAPSGLTVGELRRRSAAAEDEATGINEEHSDDRAQWTDANSVAGACVGDEITKAEDRRNEAMQQRIMSMTGMASAADMKFIQDWTAASQELQQAAVAQDSAAMQRAQDKMNKLLGVDLRADSAKARATCRVPPVPAWMRRADSLVALHYSLLEQARAVEDSARASAAQAAGMTPEQFAMAAERAEGFVRMQDAGSVDSGLVYTPVEEQALRARLVDLKRHFG